MVDVLGMLLSLVLLKERSPRSLRPKCEPERILVSGHFRLGDHLLTSFPAPPSLRDQIAEGDTSIPYYPPSEAGGTTRIRRSASITPEDSVFVGEPGRSRSSSPRRVRPTRSTRARAHSGPRSQELTFADGERERQDRFGDLETHMGDLAEAATKAEDRRERIFCDNKEA